MRTGSAPEPRPRRPRHRSLCQEGRGSHLVPSPDAAPLVTYTVSQTLRTAASVSPRHCVVPGASGRKLRRLVPSASPDVAQEENLERELQEWAAQLGPASVSWADQILGGLLVLTDIYFVNPARQLTRGLGPPPGGCCPELASAAHSLEPWVRAL